MNIIIDILFQLLLYHSEKPLKINYYHSIIL